MNLMSSLGEERFGGPNNNYIKEYFNMKDPSRPAYVNASGTVTANRIVAQTGNISNLTSTTLIQIFKSPDFLLNLYYQVIGNDYVRRVDPRVMTASC